MHRPWSVCIGKNCALCLEYGPRPAASGCTRDLGHSFSQYGPPGRWITYIYLISFGYKWYYIQYNIIGKSKNKEIMVNCLALFRETTCLPPMCPGFNNNYSKIQCHVGWVCWFSTLPWEVLRLSPLPQKPTFD